MIGIGSDDLGFALKERIREFLAQRGESVHDFGVYSAEPADYPDIGVRVAEAVRSGLIERGVLVCGTGLGMAIVANKVSGVFAAPVNSVELATAARRSNDAQIITLGGRVVSPDEAAEIVEAWLAARFKGGGSSRKVAKVRLVEERYRRARSSRALANADPATLICAARG